MAGDPVKPGALDFSPDARFKGVIEVTFPSGAKFAVSASQEDCDEAVATLTAKVIAECELLGASGAPRERAV